MHRGVTIYGYIAIHKEFISYHNTKFVWIYITIFPSSNLTVYFSFNSCPEAIASPEGVYLSNLYPYMHVYNSDSIT